MLRIAYLFSVFSLLTLISTTSAHGFQDEQEGDAEKWRPLFNGTNLDGWTPKIRGYKSGENFGETFRVVDGNLQVNYEAYDQFDQRFGHLFFEEAFSHYRLRVEYRFIDEQIKGGPGWAIRNSGLMLHGQTPESMKLDQDFPVSIEVQLLGGAEQGERPTANLCTPGTNVVMEDLLITRHCTSSKSKTYRGEQWVTVEIEVKGGEYIRHWIDGEIVLEYQKPQLDPRDADAKLLIKEEQVLLEQGTISIQSESHPVEYRKIELLDLSK